MSCAAVASWLGRFDQASSVSFQPPPAPYRAGPSFVPSVVDVMRSVALTTGPVIPAVWKRR